MNHLIAPSILAANFAALGDDIRMVNESQADWIHVDVMDGHFVPNLSLGLPVLESIRDIAEKLIDVHLMLVEPDSFLERFVKAGAQSITVHEEACTHLHRTIQAIKELGVKAGVALNPNTPVSHLEDVINDLDLVCIMSVNPGFGGQKFIPQTIERIAKLKNLINKKNAAALIQVDGGIGLKNAPMVLKAGADVLVAGSSVFNSDNPTETIAALKAVDYNTIYA